MKHLFLLFAAAAALVCTACSTPTVTNTARNSVEEMLVSAVVERGISSVDFESYAGKKVAMDYSNLAPQVDKEFVMAYIELHLARYGITVVKDAADAVIPEHECQVTDNFSSGSTDMGDLSCIMPAIHPYCGGAEGIGHGNNYRVVDAEKACVDSAKWQIAALRLLLENDAARAKEILANFKPLFASKEEYLAYLDALDRSGDRIDYGEDGVAKVDLT